MSTACSMGPCTKTHSGSATKRLNALMRQTRGQSVNAVRMWRVCRVCCSALRLAAAVGCHSPVLLFPAELSTLTSGAES